jgi:hypothetical protein
MLSGQWMACSQIGDGVRFDFFYFIFSHSFGLSARATP